MQRSHLLSSFFFHALYSPAFRLLPRPASPGLAPRFVAHVFGLPSEKRVLGNAFGQRFVAPNREVLGNQPYEKVTGGFGPTVPSNPGQLCVIPIRRALSPASVTERSVQKGWRACSGATAHRIERCAAGTAGASAPYGICLPRRP